jgi:hypothetical protein
MKKSLLQQILTDVENGREGRFTEDERYDFSINLNDITEEEKENIEEIILQSNLDQNYFETEEYECDIKQLNITITYETLQKLINYFN